MFATELVKYHPKSAKVARAYVDQLERANALNAGQISDLRDSIERAENSDADTAGKEKLNTMVSALEKIAGTTSRARDTAKAPNKRIRTA